MRRRKAKMTWVLVIFALSGNAITTVPGYKYPECLEAAAQMRKGQGPGAVKFEVLCIQGP
jgi:hypothetical protein